MQIMRQLWTWALHGLNNGRPVKLAEQNQVSTQSLICANEIVTAYIVVVVPNYLTSRQSMGDLVARTSLSLFLVRVKTC